MSTALPFSLGLGLDARDLSYLTALGTEMNTYQDASVARCLSLRKVLSAGLLVDC